MIKLETYVARYGTVAGPKLFHATQSRSAYIGANRRKRQTIAALTGRPTRAKRVPQSESDLMPLLTELPTSIDQILAPA